VKVTRPYGCVGYPLTCSAAFEVSHATAEASFTPVLRQGGVRLEKPDLELHLSKKNVSIEVSKCGFAGTLANIVLPLFKGYIVKRTVAELEGMVLEQVPPQLEPILSGLTEVSGEVPGFTVSGTLTSIATRERGIEAGARLAIAPATQSACALPPAPAPEEPTTVASIGSHSEHLGVALNRIALEKAALAVWRGGNLCGDASVLRDLNLPHQLPAWGAFLIGLSGGADLAVHTHEPPRVELLPGEGARARITLPEVSLIIDGTSTSGPTTITATATAETELQLRVNPDTRAVVLDVLAAEVSDLSLEATDPTGLRLNKSVASALIKSLVMPLVDQQLSGMEVVPQVLHDGAGPLDPYYLYLARGRTSSEYLYLYANVFRQPDHDSAPPRTWLATEQPDLQSATQTLVRLVARGSDDQTPAGLLRYRWRVGSGQWSSPGYAPVLGLNLEVGEHVVEVAAVDINGNADPTPARIEIEMTPGGVGKGDLIGWSGGEGGSGGGCAVIGSAAVGVPAPLLLLLLLLPILITSISSSRRPSES
jgi:hypothetical protein